MKLYHATFSKLLRKIKKVGYLGNSPYKLWSDSDNRYVYLASDPDEAYSYAETALDEIDNERLYDMLEDDEIVVLEIDTKYLDKNKLFKDKNVIDGETTYQYEGIINYQNLKIFDMNKYNNEIEECLRIAGVKLNESYGRMDRPFIWNDPTYSQFHRILRDNTTYGKLSAIIDNGHIYCWDSALSHHDSVVKDIEESGIKLSDDYIWVRFKEPNLCWVSAAYFDDYTDEDLEDLPQQDFEKELEDNPIIKKYFPQGVKVVRFDNISESVLNEELIHMEKSSYDEHLASIVKNPTKKELRENHLKRSRFICFADGTWLFFDPMEWIHEQVLNKYAPKFGRGKNSGFYDYDKNQFIFIHSMNYDEGEDGYEEEFNHYVNKDRKFLLSYPYIKQTFGTDFNIMVYGDWVDSPW